MPAADAYPARLEAWLNRRGDGRRHRVLNLGVPGQSTTHVLRDLPGDLEEHGPDVLLLTAGYNNTWSWDPGGAEPGRQPPWWEDLRVVKLARLVAQRAGWGGAEPSEPEVDLEEKGERLGRRRQMETIRRDVARIHELAAAAGVPLVLVGYGSDAGAYGAANQALAAAARERGLPVLSPHRELAQLLPVFGHGALFLPDSHPRALGYEVVARVVHDGLIEHGILDGEPIEDRLEGLDAVAGSPIGMGVAGDPRAAEGTPDALAIELTGGPPDVAFRMQVWGAHRGEGTSEFNAYLGEPLMQSRLPLEGRFDGEGRARVPLPARAFGLPADELPGLRFWAVCFTADRLPDGRRPTPSATQRLTVP